MSNRHEQPDWISRRLVRSKEKGVLATVMRETSGDPYASLVLTAADYQGNPLIYISEMAEHTKNLWENERASMLFESTTGLNDPLSGARISLQGKMTESKDALLVERFFKRHEQSRKYSNAHKFFLFRMEVERAHLVAGFGRIHWIDADEYHFNIGGAANLGESEDRIIQHMNEDHCDAVDLFAQNLLKKEGNGWKLIGVDPEGFDMRRKDQVVRLEFDQPLTSAEETRPVMVALVKRAREAAPSEALEKVLR